MQKYHKKIFTIFFIILNVIFISKNILTGLQEQQEQKINLFQTHYDIHNIPGKVTKNIYKYSNKYKRFLYSDTECLRFIHEEWGDTLATKFLRCTYGAHKADIWRYCILYKYGGLYMDIKTELIKPLTATFKDTSLMYVVLALNNNHIYNGIIHTPKNNPIMKDMILFLQDISVHDLNYDYNRIIYENYQVIEKYCVSKKIKPGLNKTIDGCPDIYLLQEKCSINENHCYDGLDQYSICCFVCEKINNVFVPVIKTRYSDYPWTKRLV